MNWQIAPRRVLEIAREDIEKPILKARYTALSFYTDGYLVEAETVSGIERLVLGEALGGVMTVLLDGTAAQIAMANRVSGLTLNRETVVDYTRFFCNNLRAPKGPFQIIEDAEGMRLDNGHRLGDLRMKLRSSDEKGRFRIGGYQVYDGTLHRVSLRVLPNGAMEMLNDVPLGEMCVVH